MTDHPSRLERTIEELSGALQRLSGEERARHEWEEALALLRGQLQSAERHLLALQAAGDGVWDWDVESGAIHFSEAARSLLALPEPGVAALAEWLQRLHPEDGENLRSELTSHVEGRRDALHNEHRVCCADGSERWVLLRGRALRDDSGRARRVLGTMVDITVRKAAEQLLAHQIAHDPLTGLPNRAAFLDRLERALVRARRGPDYRFAVLFLDMDRFKLVNDSLGHLCGDQLLVAVSRRLNGAVRPSDLVAHLGGDEFAILVDHMRATLDASLVSARIHQEMLTPFRVGGQEVFLTASLGIALSDGGYEKPGEMLRDADTAMYRAKMRGSGRTEMFDPQMNALALARLKLESDLRRALERDELRLQYQPIVSLASGEIVAFEALLRWAHPERGLVGPGEFVPVAEETGLIVPICGWLLGQCCRQGTRWLELVPGRGVSVSLNLAGTNLAQPGIAAQVERALRESGLAGRHLTIEITESVLMGDLQAMAKVLLELKRLEVELHIDDFGTGYSSLSYLHSLPADALKIDRTFVGALDRPGGDDVIVRTIVELAHNLGRRVVAEGVETPGQLARLRELGCEYGQGYYFSRPLDPEQAEALLRTAPRW